jgi:pimeloyl-ACP methyl ester carboxylesterase
MQKHAMKKLLKVSGLIVLILFIVLNATWLWFNEELQELNEKTRATFDETFIELPQGVVHYELAGPPAGEVVVLVHGFSVPSYIWDPTFEFLAGQGYRVLRFDLFGRGLSDRPDVAYTIDFFASQVDALTRKLELGEPFNLVGLSMGGPVTTRFTNLHPDRVRHLILVDPLVHAPPPEDLAPLAMPLVGGYLANVYLMPKLASGQTSDFVDKSKFPNWEDRFREQMRFRGFRRAIVSTLLNFDGPEILGEYGKLGQLNVSVNVFWGRQDQTTPLEHSQKLLERVPQAGLAVIDRAGHLPHLERPEVFNPLLLDLLRSR